MVAKTVPKFDIQQEFRIAGRDFKGDELKIKFTYKDRITPTLADIQTLVGQVFRNFHIPQAEFIKEAIFEEFINVDSRAPVTNPYSLIWKRGGVSPITGLAYPPAPGAIGVGRALVLTGRLWEGIRNISFVHEEIEPGHIVSHMSGDLPIYTGIHEFGPVVVPITPKMRGWLLGNLGLKPRGRTMTIPKRDFLSRGLRRGLREYAKMYGTFMQEVKRLMQESAVKPLVITEMGPEIGLLSFSPFGAVGYLLFLAPPIISPGLAVWGAYGDITSFLEGKFSPELATLYARSMLLGRLGITKKTFRRRVRGRIFQ